jgi:hypothetical protein
MLSKHRVALKRPKCEIVVWRTGWLGFERYIDAAKIRTAKPRDSQS